MAGFPPRMGFPPPMMGMSSPPMMGMPPPMFGGPPPPMGYGGPPPPMGYGGPPPPMGYGGGPPARQQPPPQQQQQRQPSPRATAAPAPAAGGAATGGWEEHKAPDGRTYYYHGATKKSTWDKPAEMKSPGEAACPWKEYTSSDGSGKKYYYNTQTKKSVWVMPDELKRIKEAAAMQAEEKKSEEAEKRRQEAESAKAMAEAKAKAQARAEQKAKEEAVAREAEEEKRKKELAANPPPASQAAAGGKKAEPGSYTTKEEARAAFKQLLSDKEVGGTWSWAKAMGAIITDPRYNALKTIGEKKHVFGEWASKRAVEEKVEKRNRSRRAREAFATMLREQAEAGALGASARAADVQRLLEGDPRWAAVESSHDRQEMVAEHLRELQHRERDAERQQRKLSSKRFEAALRAKEWFSGAPPTTWRRVEEEFRNEEVFTSMRREDRLQVFQDVIGALERSAAQQARAQARREERRARERFRELLAEHSGPGSTGRITALSRWAECRTWLREDARWLPTDGRAGSLACELFDDVVEEQEAELRKNIERATPLLAAAGVTLSAATTLEQVRAVLLPPTAAGEEAAASGGLVDEATLPLLHGAMVRGAERREKQAARAQARTAERYLALLKDYSKQKDITVESSWGAETIELLSAHSSYKALGEDERKSLFEGFVVKLAAKKKEKEERRAEKKAKKAAKKAAKKHHRHSDSGSGSDSDGDGGGGGGKRARSDAK